MKKTFTCRELGGICDEEISGGSFMELIQNGAKHMQTDQAHMDHVKNLAQNLGEDQKEWVARMQKKFESRSPDA